MGFKTRQEVVQALATTPDYIELFTGAFPEDDEPLSFENICTALATFERGLTTPSRWDMFLKGDRNALTKDEIRGFFVFKEAGCARCHKGTYMGGQTFVRLGRVIPWPEEVDPGRFSVTRNKADYGKFKVPSLRNVTQTKPYLHDGREPSLKKVVEMMARHEKGRTLSKLQMNYLLQFLETLTGSLPLEYIREPDLPGNH
jgi:cytochrome c peroxidase